MPVGLGSWKPHRQKSQKAARVDAFRAALERQRQKARAARKARR
jgi:hypothetical protein